MADHVVNRLDEVLPRFSSEGCKLRRLAVDGLDAPIDDAAGPRESWGVPVEWDDESLL